LPDKRNLVIAFTASDEKNTAMMHHLSGLQSASISSDLNQPAVLIVSYLNASMPVATKSCIGYLGYPFEKESPWAFTARFFLVVQWNSATDGGGKSFSSTRENTEVWAANHQGRHAQAA
jgi:hypothetical protein